MLKPSYEIKIGNETYKPGSQSPVLSITVNTSIDIPADSFEFLLGISDETKKIEEGDSAAIKLGYEDALKNVFVGEVDNVVPEINYIRVFGLNFASNEYPKLPHLLPSIGKDHGAKGFVLLPLVRRDFQDLLFKQWLRCS